ncbi:hypothetical protein H8D36_02450 [archaeon]|nr:hypothetical protein [archaeon]MBL7057212.1 hypothetical protein [Candidatus Woesearchaeota archaeon]
MNKKGVEKLMGLTVTAIIVIALIFISYVFIDRFVIQRGPDFEDFTKCTNMPGVESAECLDNKEACKEKGGTSYSFGCGEEKICCAITKFS